MSRAMDCPACGHDATAVTDARPVDGKVYRRRRRCHRCGHRFMTYESTISPEQLFAMAEAAKQTAAVLAETVDRMLRAGRAADMDVGQ